MEALGVTFLALASGAAGEDWLDVEAGAEPAMCPGSTDGCPYVVVQHTAASHPILRAALMMLAP
jgi:hypothetical protein